MKATVVSMDWLIARYWLFYIKEASLLLFLFVLFELKL